MPRVLIVTLRLRAYGRALASALAMRKAHGRPVDTLEIQNEEGETGNQKILAGYSLARDVFLRGGWSHMLTLEDDMVIPPDTLDRLLAAEAPVAYSLYCWRYGRNRDHLWSPYVRVFEDQGCSWSDDQPQTIARWAREGRVIDVAGLGLGCTLIRRDVLERIPFRLPADAPAANDWYFAYDCVQAKIRQVCDLGVVCGHIRADPSLRVIWPDLAAERRPMARYEYFEEAA
jgi:hypothetical protein